MLLTLLGPGECFGQCKMHANFCSLMKLLPLLLIVVVFVGATLHFAIPAINGDLSRKLELLGFINLLIRHSNGSEHYSTSVHWYYFSNHTATLNQSLKICLQLIQGKICINMCSNTFSQNLFAHIYHFL